MDLGDFASATILLAEKALKVNPSSDIAKCFLGVVSYYCGALGEALLIMNEVINNGNDASAIGIARTVVDEINSKQ
jgi:hypothetical protein